jgi:hypothetical protein
MAAATTVFNLNKWLQEAGEERLPIVRWIEYRSCCQMPKNSDHLFEQATHRLLQA